MYVSVSLWFPGEPINTGKVDFWQAFQRRRSPGDGAGSYGDLAPATINFYDEQFRREFPIHLQRHLNQEMASIAASRPRFPVIVPQEISVRLLAIHYGSIKAILDIVGFESTDLRDLLLTALSIYAPVAFNDSVHDNVNISASPQVMAGDAPEASSARQVTPGPATSSASQVANVPATSSTSQVANDVRGTTTMSARANDAVARIWTITNLTLVVPVLLAFVVLYYAYSGLLHELEGLRRQAADIRVERTDILRMLVDQNKALSTLNGDQAKQAFANEKAMRDALIGISRGKADDPAQDHR
jgi:hypothetical protein